MSAVTLRTTLAAPPSADHDARGQGRLHLQLHIDGCCNPIRATVYYAGLGAAGFAHRDALRLKQGDAVTVYAAGLGDEGGGALRLFGVDHFDHHPAQTCANRAA